jgi:hypothetical protein
MVIVSCEETEEISSGFCRLFWWYVIRGKVCNLFESPAYVEIVHPEMCHGRFKITHFETWSHVEVPAAIRLLRTEHAVAAAVPIQLQVVWWCMKFASSLC